VALITTLLRVLGLYVGYFFAQLCAGVLRCHGKQMTLITWKNAKNELL